MKVSLLWLQDVAFSSKNEFGNEIIFDGPTAYGGHHLGMRPMEGMLSSAAACSAFDVVNILKKSKQQLQSLTVDVQSERADSIPAVFTKIHLHFILQGVLSEAAVDRAIELSVEKYCSALAMINKTATITHSRTIQ